MKLKVYKNDQYGSWSALVSNQYYNCKKYMPIKFVHCQEANNGDFIDVSECALDCFKKKDDSVEFNIAIFNWEKVVTNKKKEEETDFESHSSYELNSDQLPF